jgi:hypothetical protein
MKNIWCILGIILVVVLVAGCTQQLAKRSYTNTVYGFSLSPPPGWVRVDNELTSVAVWFAPENFSNVSLVIGTPFSLGEGLALSTFADQIEENLSNTGENYSIVYRDWLSLPGVKAYEIAYSYEQDGITVRVKQVAVLKTRTVFLVTFTAPSAQYIKYLTVVDQSIDTFV